MSKSFDDFNQVWPEYIKVGTIVYPPGGTLGPRIQSTIELVLLHDGHMTVYVDEKPYFADQKTVTILFPGHDEYYIFSKDTPTHHSYVHIALPNAPPVFQERLRRLPRAIVISKQMDAYLAEMLALKNSNLATRDLLLKTQSMLMLWLFIGEGERLCNHYSEAPQKKIVETACRFITAHLSEEINLETIAREVSVCPEYLIRVFNQDLHITPMSYLWKKRVSLGIDLLEHSGLLISQIADRCGFKNRTHFSRKILEATGASPKDVRQKAWQKAARVE